MRGIRRKLHLFTLLGLACVMVLAFQNCGPQPYFLNQNSLASKNDSTPSGGGNGGSYDGKPQIYHHNVPGFTCEGAIKPESILIREIMEPGPKWYLIQNSPEKCSSDRVAVEGVTLDSITNTATYNGKLYVPPSDYYVDASENPNLDDLDINDAICATINQKCSLRAAFQQAGFSSGMTPVTVHIPAAVYSLTKALDLIGWVRGNSITIQGEDAATTIFDGQNSTHHISMQRIDSPVTFKNITFTGGYHSSKASAIQLPPPFPDTSNPDIPYTFQDCRFVRNLGLAPIEIVSTSDSFLFQRVTFESNKEDGLFINSYILSKVVVEDSYFFDNAFNGLRVAYTTPNITIRRSSFVSNQTGLNLTGCHNCLIENSTIYGNSASGAKITYASSGPFPAGNQILTFQHVTLYENGSATGGVSFELHDVPTNHLLLQNSIVATNNDARSNCNFNGSTAVDAVAAFSTLFDNSRCGASGTGNVVGNPLLGPLTSTSGPAPVLIPRGTSPAVNSADPGLCLPEDQVGKARFAAACDRGAIELLLTK